MKTSLQDTPTKRHNNNITTQGGYYYNNFTFADNKSPKDSLSISDNNHNNNGSSNSNGYVNQLHLIQAYQDEIIKLKTKNISLRQENEMLNDELYTKSSQEESYYMLLNEFLSLLNITSIDAIIPTLTALVTANTNDKLRDEFISKVNDIHSELTGNENNGNIKQLWEWLRKLIQTLKTEMRKSNNTSNNNNAPIYTYTYTKPYKDCCNKLINEYNIKDINELKCIINELLSKHNPHSNTNTNNNSNQLYIYDSNTN